MEKYLESGCVGPITHVKEKVDEIHTIADIISFVSINGQYLKGIQTS